MSKRVVILSNSNKIYSTKGKGKEVNNLNKDTILVSYTTTNDDSDIAKYTIKPTGNNRTTITLTYHKKQCKSLKLQSYQGNKRQNGKSFSFPNRQSVEELKRFLDTVWNIDVDILTKGSLVFVDSNKNNISNLDILKNLDFGKVDKTELKNIIQSIVNSGNIQIQDIDFIHTKKKVIADYEKLMSYDALEKKYQDLFEKNGWIFNKGSISILGQRIVDQQNILDISYKNIDHFVDIIEIKRYKTSATFWAKSIDHDNLIIHSDLIKAITQCQNYIFSLEKKINDHTYNQQVGSVCKPRATLVFGSSEGWDEKHWQSFRILNSSYHSLDIITHDMLLSRCKKIIEQGS